uniref:Uncharacterized protein n=1 Tax=Arundo donax TaxID=35708 RepID=A0A0A9F861_ARUDO
MLHKVVGRRGKHRDITSNREISNLS